MSGPDEPTRKQRFLVTAALPYANGPLHIGHMAGAYLPADIYVRFLRRMGKEVLFVCGSDEHGVPILVRARQEGKTPQEIVDYYHTLNQQTFEQFGIRFDVYFRTSHPLHHQIAQNFFLTLHQKGYLIEREIEQFYDPEIDMFLADRYILGTCPYCGYENAYGDQCEKCGTALSPDELKNPRSALTGKPPVRRKTRHWFFDLPRFTSWLRQWLLEEKAQTWKANVIGQCRSWLTIGLQPRAVTRDLPWGVPVPLSQAKGKVLYVWFEAPIGYISATQYYCQEHNLDWRQWWQDPNTALIHFIGKDNIVFHAIIFPAMLKAHGEYILPENVPANEFMNLEGRKISTSQNWAVWIHEFIQRHPDYIDAMRFVLTRLLPETRDSEFTWRDFHDLVQGELVGTLGNYLHRIWTLAYRLDVHTSWQTLPVDRETLRKLQPTIRQIAQAIHTFRFREALNLILQIAREGNQHLALEAPWQYLQSDRERAATILRTHLERFLLLTALIEPITPFTIAQIWQQWNIPNIRWEQLLRIGEQPLFHGEQPIPPPRIPYPRVHESMIQQEVHHLKEQAQPEEAREQPPTSSHQTISIHQFQQIQLVTGRILHVQNHPRAQRLYILQVDVGKYGRRQIVAGIRPYYTPEELQGKTVILVLNLEPKEIRGVRSEGMLLAAEDPNSGKVILLTTDEPTVPGASIR